MNDSHAQQPSTLDPAATIKSTLAQRRGYGRIKERSWQSPAIIAGQEQVEVECRSDRGADGGSDPNQSNSGHAAAFNTHHTRPTSSPRNDNPNNNNYYQPSTSSSSTHSENYNGGGSNESPRFLPLPSPSRVASASAGGRHSHSHSHSSIHDLLNGIDSITPISDPSTTPNQELGGGGVGFKSQDQTTTASSSTPNSNSRHQCTIGNCHKDFTRLHDLKRHVASIHGLNNGKIIQAPTPTSQPSASGSNSAGKAHQCPNCKKAFSRKDALRRHVRSGLEKGNKCAGTQVGLTSRGTTDPHSINEKEKGKGKGKKRGIEETITQGVGVGDDGDEEEEELELESPRNDKTDQLELEEMIRQNQLRESRSNTHYSNQSGSTATSLPFHHQRSGSSSNLSNHSNSKSSQSYPTSGSTINNTIKNKLSHSSATLNSYVSSSPMDLISSKETLIPENGNQVVIPSSDYLKIWGFTLKIILVEDLIQMMVDSQLPDLLLLWSKSRECFSFTSFEEIQDFLFGVFFFFSGFNSPNTTTNPYERPLSSSSSSSHQQRSRDQVFGMPSNPSDPNVNAQDDTVATDEDSNNHCKGPSSTAEVDGEGQEDDDELELDQLDQ
ncbi:hypothetical protein L7F22_001226 [Adiantum nelumboides]|nr:hypothetical protein [Adiantum nelumboides]